MQLITRETLSNILGIQPSTVKLWLNGYRFTKFCSYTKRNGRRTIVLNFCEEFIDRLKDFLEVTGHYKELDNLENFLKNSVCLI